MWQYLDLTADFCKNDYELSFFMHHKGRVRLTCNYECFEGNPVFELSFPDKHSQTDLMIGMPLQPVIIYPFMCLNTKQEE